MWPIFIALHLVGLVGYNLLLRKSLLAKQDRFLLATVMQTGIGLPMLFVLLFRGINPGIYLNGQILLTTVVIILLIVSLHYSVVRSLEYLEASVFSVLYNLRIIFTTILGILFLGEPTIWVRIIGGLLILAGIFVVKQKGSKTFTAKGFEWGIAAAAVISILNMFVKSLIDQIGYLNYAIPVMVGAMIIMWVILLNKKVKADYSVFKQPRTIVLMIFRAMSAYAFTLAFATGALLSVASYLSSMSVILIVIFRILLLNERDYLYRKIAATALASIGLTIILLTNLI